MSSHDLYISNLDLQPASARILNSWKEIASYLGRGVRTVQRYERQLGLPVHRPAVRERSSVLAFPDELERWLRDTPNGNGAFSDSGDSHLSSPLKISPPNAKGIQLTIELELERAKREMEEARAEYQRAVELYSALKRRYGKGKAISVESGKLQFVS